MIWGLRLCAGRVAGPALTGHTRIREPSHASVTFESFSISQKRRVRAEIDSHLPLTCEAWSRLLPHQQQRIGAGRNALPGRGVALGEAPGAAGPGEHKLVTVEPPGRQTYAGDRRIAARLH